MPRRVHAALAAGLALAALTGSHASAASGAGNSSPPPESASPSIVLDARTRHQSIDGFGFSQAFQRADVMHGARGLSEQHQREVLDLLLSRDKGAGLSILRLGIGSSAEDPYDLMRSIAPTDPGGPDAEPVYEWDGDDGGQVWLAKEAKAYGVRRFYADAWSAPGYMKDNGSDSNGGTLCGLSGTSCAGGDWRRAYAEYLVQYTRFYAREGIKITDLGFTNEPDLTVPYASMRFTPEQAAEFVKVLGPVAARAGLKVACCDAAGWDVQERYTKAIEADPQAARWVATHTGHPYVDPIDHPLPTRRPTWMSEWSPNGTTWNENWDDGSGYDGFAVASNIHEALATANVSGYVYWFGASLGATRGLIQLDGDAYRVSKRLWALAAYSRFIRPGAVRIGARTTAEGLKVSAFRNADGSRVVEILNTGTAAVSANLVTGGGRATAYRTDAENSLTPVNALRGHGAHARAELAPRSLTTIVLDGRGHAG
ncbi:glycoside hydrolase [Sphaerisporangium sp. TRM90804]|uniref:glycoside hydrolase family 30 protein n=1 Tax=Sphaerisporangium sp. TRM90804 TaxID=3031113 RepID=UPI0024476515|nr:glycoside hydrolase [Sphaerisporangium sp. TRM90804]MDH2424368.1 glycoside hydrolase [Sphaerisporangium sp. TRM90804]